MPRKRDRNPPSAYEKAIALLARREHSARELKAKLERRGFDSQESAATLKNLQSKNFQDDARFGEMLVRSRIAGGYGPRWIIAELKTHGIAEDAASALVDAAEPDWPALIRVLLRRRHGAKQVVSVAERRQRVDFLLRRGFDASTVQSITHAGLVDSPDAAD